MVFGSRGIEKTMGAAGASGALDPEQAESRTFYFFSMITVTAEIINPMPKAML